MTTLLVVLSFTALAAAGIVIMNLMLASVSQRTHEIGLRRAAGARASDIRSQFLMETLIVSLAGGALGVSIGVVTALVLAATGMAPARVTWVPFAAAFMICGLIGVLFGIPPARRAASVAPATALRKGQA
jgi:putative ABC transport system permease protein